MKKLIKPFLMGLVLLSMIACSTNIHKIGNGAQTLNSKTARQWYVLFGLVPINEVDTNEMAANAQNYEIKTEQTFVDGIITAFTSMVSVSCRSVTVTK